MEPERIPETKHDSVQCAACDGRGRWLLDGGVGPLGDDCPYCYQYRFEGYPVGWIPDSVHRPFDGEETGERFYHVIDRQTRAPTNQNERFRVIHLPQEPTLYPRRGKKAISRPRRRVEPLPSDHGGSVRHFNTGLRGFTRYFRTGPYTHARRQDQQREFLKAYDTLKADRRAREIWLWRLTQVACVLICIVALTIAIGAGVIIMMTLRTRLL